MIVPCQATVTPPSNDDKLGYPHPEIGNTLVPRFEMSFKVPEGEGMNAIGTRTMGAGCRLKAGADDQIYYVLWVEEQANG